MGFILSLVVVSMIHAAFLWHYTLTPHHDVPSKKQAHRRFTVRLAQLQPPPPPPQPIPPEPIAPPPPPPKPKSTPIPPTPKPEPTPPKPPHPLPKPETAHTQTPHPKQDQARLRKAKRTYLGKVRRLIQRHKHYPRTARRRKQQGAVFVRFTILRDGTIRDIRLKRRSDYSALNKAAVRIFRRIGSFPPVPEGVPAPMTITVPVRYKI
jgi:protein TonB